MRTAPANSSSQPVNNRRSELRRDPGSILVNNRRRRSRPGHRWPPSTSLQSLLGASAVVMQASLEPGAIVDTVGVVGLSTSFAREFPQAPMPRATPTTATAAPSFIPCTVASANTSRRTYGGRVSLAFGCRSFLVSSRHTSSLEQDRRARTIRFRRSPGRPSGSPGLQRVRTRGPTPTEGRPG